MRIPLSAACRRCVHAGVSARNLWCPDILELERMMGAFPNLYADISSLTQVNRLRALAPLLASAPVRERLVYGTDMPILATAAVDPAYFAFRLPWARCREIRRMRNPWDQDVALKRALGVDDAVFRRAGAVLAARGRLRRSRSSGIRHPISGQVRGAPERNSGPLPPTDHRG